VNEDTPIESEVIMPLGRHGIVNIGSTKPDAFTEQEIDLIELWSDTLATAFGRITQMELLQDREAELVRERDRLNEFASVVSHDLRNPLSVAHGQATILQQRSDGEFREHLEPLIDSLERMESIIEDTLTLAQQGETIGEMEPIRGTDLISKCWEGVETAEATLQIDDEFTIRGDPDRLRHVFENLFRNAVEHGDDDVTVRVGRAGEDRLYVEDDGPGISLADRETVLKPGYTSADGGTGLGLTIVKRIAEAHGWEMTVTDGRDGGARFEFDTT
jgi:signal transduction histidine kinase